MTCWRSFVFAILAFVLLAGCVYVPPYYEDPLSPPPWGYPVEPYPRRYERHGHRPDPYVPRRRYYERRDDGNYRPDVTPSDPDLYDGDRQEVVPPPSKREVPAPSKGSEPRVDAKDTPVATKGSKPGRVKIPFPPYSELDVTGLLPGSLAKDPTSGKVFRLP